ncbi:CRISPR-associated DxTHG motif protein [Streptomyces albidoflavus]|nr:CRISPR-associated DxTHG motif protein [Streptomyces violascens]RWZ76015.1 CRISPR-associated DxTHG motif protein [Streptomyces albidoflavus]
MGAGSCLRVTHGINSLPSGSGPCRRGT